ncbi:MAG: PorT family protein [Bacteroidales bacterium]|nr:PorT family protein [Bacteroidales bacterium]
MKKLFTTTLALLLVASLTAQISFGPRAGFNLTNIHESYGSISINGDFRPGFQLGVVANIPVLGELLSIQPGLLFAQQGTKFNDFLGTGMDATFNLNYLQVPVNAQLGFGVGENARVLLQAGPYLGIALGGNIKVEQGNFSYTEDISFGSGEDEMRHFDFGVGFGAGVQFGRFQVGIGYNLGIANLSNADDVTTRNSGLAFTVTYLFGGDRR